VGERVADRLRAVADAGLHEDAVDVRLDGRRRDDQALGDLGVAEAVGDQREDLRLARGQVVGQDALGGRRRAGCRRSAI